VVRESPAWDAERRPTTFDYLTGYLIAFPIRSNARPLGS